MYGDFERKEVQEIVKEKQPTHYHIIQNYTKLDLNKIHEDVKR
jgi:hypothetical protein